MSLSKTLLDDLERDLSGEERLYGEEIVEQWPEEQESDAERLNIN